MSTDFKVDHNIPLPSVNRGAPPTPIRYPWDNMGIGDSFFVPILDKTIMSIRGFINSDLKKYQHQFGKKYKITTRAIDDGIRVWRIK